MYRIATLLYATLFLAIAAAPATAQEEPTTERVSVASDGTQGDGAGFPSWTPDPAISADGRYVAFTSAHTNLVPGDTNNFCWPTFPFNCQDVFVHDRETGTTERVSVSSDGTEGNHSSAHPAISADGRYVTFISYASNLVPGDMVTCRDAPIPGLPTTCGDIFVHDRETGTTEMVSVDSNGNQGNQRSIWTEISADGRYVMFTSQANNLDPDPNACASCIQVYVHDRETGTTERVSVDSEGNAADSPGAVGRGISADGRYVAFSAGSSNLVPDDTNGAHDAFVHDRETGITERVSVASDGAEGNSNSQNPFISADGRYVAFRSSASNLVPGDTNGEVDIFVHDRETGTTERVSVASDGAEANDRSLIAPEISDDGRYVSFGSRATNLVPGDTNGEVDIFVHDRETGTTERVSVAHNGAEANAPSGTNVTDYHAMNTDGRYVAFFSGASNLVPGDTNDWWDIFVRDRGSMIVATEDDPSTFHLSNATPNPASGSTSLSLRVPEAQNVTARVYDTLGRQVAVIHNGPLAAGEDVRLEIDTAALATGAYLVRVEGETFAETRRVTVVR